MFSRLLGCDTLSAEKRQAWDAGVERSVGVGETATAEMSVGETEGRNNRSSARRYGRNGARQLGHIHSLTVRELRVDAPPCPMTPAIALIGPTRAV